MMKGRSLLVCVTVVLVFMFFAPSSEGREEYVFKCAWPEEGIGFNTIHDIALDDLGNIYVAESSNGRTIKIMPDQSKVSAFGFFGNGNGNFGCYPHDLAIDKSGDVYICDNWCIEKFSSDGIFLKSWEALHKGDFDFAGLDSIAVDSSKNIYVVDGNDYCIAKIDQNGVILAQWGREGSGNGEFLFGSSSIALDNTGNVYVADTSNHRIQKFTSDGKFIMKWDTPGEGNGQFYRPRDLTIDDSGNIYVLVGNDTGRLYIQEFTSDGIFLKQFDWCLHPKKQIISVR